MTAYLLAISVGPVQEFIAAARRTRDLWFGSYLLSEVSKAVARSIRDAGGRLIFPHPDTDLTVGPKMNVANVIVAEIPADKGKLEETAKAAAKACWQTFAKSVIRDKAIAAVVRQEIWTEQVNDVVEFYAAWVPLPTPDEYKVARAHVMRLLAGRKNCRDFKQAVPHPGLPKSSLDGMRDTVLLGPRDDEDPQTYRSSWSKETRRKLRVRTGEQLDVVGLVKRTCQPEEGEPHYPSVSRIAADPWLRGCAAKHPTLLEAVRRACDALGRQVIRRIDVSDVGHNHYATFPYEGTAVFRNRYHELIEEAELDPADLRPLANAVARLGEPNPYLAVLVADGDNMGKTISELASPGEHQALSRELSKFAKSARSIVHDQHGVLVYAGGDDVLAFVPVDQCLDCARRLHDTFGELMTDLVDKLNGGRAVKLETNITLSVGVAIGHFMENLEDLREYGQAAEKHAKTPDANGVKDALAVHMHKRGGSPIKVRAKWTDNLDARLRQLADWLIQKKIPNRLATDLNRMADVYAGWRGDSSKAIVGDMLRVIRAKQPGGGAVIVEMEEALKAQVKDAGTLRQLALELLISRQIATAFRQATGQENGGNQ